MAEAGAGSLCRPLPRVLLAGLERTWTHLIPRVWRSLGLREAGDGHVGSWGRDLRWPTLHRSRGQAALRL